MNKPRIKLLLLLSSLVLLVSCTHVYVPAPVVSTSASWDGSERNSGFQGWATNSTGVYGILTPHAHDRYNSLIAVYGNKFMPPIKKNYGITDNGTNYYITLEGLSDFAKMNRWKKSTIDINK